MKKKYRPVSSTQPAPAQPAGEIQNSLGDAIGYNVGNLPFPQSQGTGFSPQISQATPMFYNMRWYLISNFRQLLSEAYVEIGLIQTVIDVPIDDALRGGIEIRSDQLSEDEIEELLGSLDRDDDINTIGQAAKWNRLFGGSGIIVIVEGQDPMEPLDLDAIGPDTDIEFRAADLWELFFSYQDSDGYDPSQQMENYEYFNYYGEQIHKSRVMVMKGTQAPSFIRPRLRGWGFSVVEVLVRSINQYLKATDLTFEVLDEFKLDIYKIKNLVNTLMSPMGKQKVQERVQLANWQKNYQHAVVMDSEDDFDHKQLSFAGLAEAMEGIRIQVASDLRMPLTKIFGVSSAGFNSGEDDIEVYNSMVESQVRNKIKYQILRLCEIKCQKLFGYVPDDLKISFKSLRTMKAVDEETVKTQKFQRALQALQAGEITHREFRDACNKGQLLDISLSTEGTDLDGYMSDEVDEDGEAEKDTDTDDPGTNRTADKKPEAKAKGGMPKGEVKNEKFDESKHPRADDGKFGSAGTKKLATKLEKMKAKTAALREKLEKTKERTAKSREELEKETTSAAERSKTVSDLKTKIAAVKAETKRIKKTIPIENVKPYTTWEKVSRKLENSAAFDRASYRADGGEKTIDSRRELFFDRDKAKDKDKWDQAVKAAKAAQGTDDWKFIVWMYKKLGGSF